MGRKGKRNATTDTKRCHINSLEKLRAHAAKVQTQSTQLIGCMTLVWFFTPTTEHTLQCVQADAAARNNRKREETWEIAQVVGTAGSEVSV